MRYIIHTRVSEPYLFSQKIMINHTHVTITEFKALPSWAHLLAAVRMASGVRLVGQTGPQFSNLSA